MANLNDSIQLIARRGNSILEDVAGTAAVSGDTMADMLADACKDATDWVCVLAALAEWDAGAISDVIDGISEVAEVFGDEWKEHRLG